ncbi:MAG: acetylornithine deacetylase [Planctomycetota bacterium]
MLSDTELLARLVAFDSTSRNSNLPIADFICEYAGGVAERQESPDGTKVNLILRFGPRTDSREGLVLCGHMDVVPAEEPEWSSDPFVLRDDGERLYGRGACDMKGFLAVALNVALEARELKAPLVLVFTYDEEVGTRGARRLVEHWPGVESLPRNAIVGEPTMLRVVSMHKGHCEMRVTLKGRSAHSGYPHLGRNAIEAAGRVIAAMRGLRHELEREGGPCAERYPESPFVTLNLGTVRGGSAVNVVPDRCEIDLGARLLPGMGLDDLVPRVREKVQAAAGEDQADFEVRSESPPLHLERDAPVHRLLCELAGQERGEAVSYATDAGWLARAGVDCAICGPGSIEVAHRPDEHLSKAQLGQAHELFAQAVHRMCC